jgi:predicted DNA-binding WGR domain protein
MITCTLRRIDPARHMARFYAMDVQPDLFGCIILTKQWGRIGTHGRRVGESHATEALAVAALQRQAERKRRGGISKAQRRVTGIRIDGCFSRQPISSGAL